MNPSLNGRLSIWIALVVVMMLAGGVWQQRDLYRLRMEHSSLLALARSRGINPDVPDALPAKPYPRRDLKGDARALAEALIRRAENGAADKSDWAEQIELADRLEGLNPAQLREMIGIFLKADEMPEPIRLQVTLDLLRRLGKDFPEEALAQMAELEARLSEDFARHNFLDRRAAIANRFGELSPDAAWKWYLDSRKDGPEGFDQVREAVLGGIARRDPGLALRYAEESGGEETGIYFLGHYCTTLDQRVAALKALRAWSGEDSGKRAMLDQFIQDQTLRQGFQETVRFEDVTSWIEQGGLTSEEISFLGDRSKVDLSYHIDPRDSGKLIEWLDRTFPEKQAARQIKHLMEDSRTRDSAKTWLGTLPLGEAAALEKRLADD